MSPKAAVIIGVTTVGLGALAIYGKKQYDLFSETVYFDYDKSSVRIIKVGINESRFSVDFIIDNRGKLSLDVKDIELKVVSGNTILSRINKNGEFRIIPNSITPVNLEIGFSPSKLVKSNDINIANYKDLPLTFIGSVKVKKMGIWIKVPFKFTYKVSEFM